VAIPKVLEQVGLKVSDIDLFELNEAFASQATYCCETLGLDMNKVNVKGGAIALGHPLGCTGARLMATIIPELKRRKARYGVISMCIGTGMGAAAVIENIDN
jgi:acetyl-CoA acyltransferase 1